jgi:hypothetical protein
MPRSSVQDATSNRDLRPREQAFEDREIAPPHRPQQRWRPIGARRVHINARVSSNHNTDAAPATCDRCCKRSRTIAPSIRNRIKKESSHLHVPMLCCNHQQRPRTTGVVRSRSRRKQKTRTLNITVHHRKTKRSEAVRTPWVNPQTRSVQQQPQRRSVRVTHNNT